MHHCTSWFNVVEPDFIMERIVEKQESELKFTFELSAAASIKRGVESVCIADEAYSENVISSVYFDTPDWVFAMDKASSDYLKTKIRLRWYRSKSDDDGGPPSKCFLEFKRKIGSKRTKKRVLMPFGGEEAISRLQEDDCLDMIRGHLSENAPDLTGLFIEPKFVVRYKRSRYYEPFSGTRISFDTDIHAFSVGRNFAQFSADIVLDESVLEVKGVCDDMPQALRSFHAGRLRKAAFSKYYESFKLLTGYEQ